MTAGAVCLGLLVMPATRADIEIVAESGAPAPGEAAGVEFSRFRAPVIGRTGHVAFWARMVGPDISSANNDTIFAGIPRFLHKVVQKNDPAPGTDAGVVFSAFPTNVTEAQVVVSESGDVAFVAQLTGPGVTATNNDGVWAEIDGSLELIAREGQLLPGGAMLNALFDFAFTDAGIALFVGTDAGSDQIWLHRGGALDKVVAEGDPAPGFVDCTVNGMWRPTASPSGKLAFRALLLADVGGASCPITMYVLDGAEATAILSQGDPAPELPAGTTFGDFSAGANILVPKINAHGDMILHGNVSVPTGGQPIVLASSWVVRAEGNLELLAIEDEWMPSDAAVTITGLSAEGAINAAGRGALRASVSGGTAILAGAPRASFGYDPLTNVGAIGMAEVARTGQPVAGGEAGWTYVSLDVPFTNDSGHVTFNGDLSIGGTCLWTGPAGGLTLVMCEGQPVDVVDPLTGLRNETPNTMLALTNVPAPDGAGSGDGLPSAFSDTGQVVSRVAFADIGTTAVVIYPAGPVDTDADGIPDYREGSGDLDGDGLPNFDDVDADGDGADDALDTCPPVANPAQEPAPFGQVVTAANAYRFEWPVAITYVAARGGFTAAADIGSFAVDAIDASLGRDLAVPELPEAGTGFWYLLRPDCDAASWTSEGPGELAGRDAALP
jgi:hypothetical protein